MAGPLSSVKGGGPFFVYVMLGKLRSTFQVVNTTKI